MARVLAKAVRDRERALRDDLVVRLRPAAPHGSPASAAHRIVADARRRYRRHNAARRFVESEVFAELALVRSRRADRPPEVRERAPPRPVRCARRSSGCGRCSPRRSCSTTSSARKALLRHAGRDVLRRRRVAGALPLPRSDVASTHGRAGPTTTSPLLDEARALLGPGRGAAAPARPADDEIRTYGHIVVDEAQDLSPMQLRMLERRSLNGSMTVVGDIAQATGPWAHGSTGTRSSRTCPDAARPASPSSPSATACPRPSWSSPPGCCASRRRRSRRPARSARTAPPPAIRRVAAGRAGAPRSWPPRSTSVQAGRPRPGGRRCARRRSSTT